MFDILCNMGFTAECSGKEVLDILTLSAFIKKFNVSEIYILRGFWLLKIRCLLYPQIHTNIFMTNTAYRRLFRLRENNI